MLDRWAVVAHAGSPFEADMVRANLIQAGIPTLVADPREFSGTLLYQGRVAVRIMVEQPNVESAVNLLRSSQLLNTES